MFEIVTDSSSNLSWKYMFKNKIKMIPLLYFIDGKEFECQSPDNFDGELFFSRLKKINIKTSLINTERFTARFEPLLKRGRDILYIGMSTGVSGSTQSARLASNELREQYPDRKIYIIDTLCASLAEGIFVLRAVELRDSGKSLEDIVNFLEKLVPHVCQFFMVDDLTMLKRGGRISGAVALLGTALNIKPILKGNEEGKIDMISKARGKEKGLEALCELYEQHKYHTEGNLVAISHGGCPHEAEKLAKMIKKITPGQEILIECFEQVMGSHVGPGTVALFFEGQHR